MSLSKPKGVRFSEEELGRLNHAAEQLGISVNDLIRRLVDKGLAVCERDGFDLNLKKTEFDIKKATKISYSEQSSAAAARLNEPSKPAHPKRSK